MLRLIVFVAVMAALAPEITSVGRTYCGPETFVPWRCGSFWWFALVIAGALAELAYSIHKKRDKRKAPR